jgi:hypothetical protein
MSWRAFLLLFGSQSAAQNATDVRLAHGKEQPPQRQNRRRMAGGHPDLSGFYAGEVELGNPNEEDGGHKETSIQCCIDPLRPPGCHGILDLS